MRSQLSLTIIALTLFGISTTAPAYSDQAARDIRTHSAERARLVAAVNKQPLRFEPNRGQTDPRVRFLSRGPGYTLFLTPDAATLSLRSGNIEKRSGKSYDRFADRNLRSPRQEVLRMRLEGSNKKARATGIERLPGSVNYFRGKDRSKWAIGVPTFQQARFQNVYPGTDLVYYGKNRQLEYDFHLKPGANPGSIRLAFDGAKSVKVDKDGDLRVQMSSGTLHWKKPVTYQTVAGKREFIASRYLSLGKNRIGFQVARYDTRRPLVIDPVLVYASFLGGSDDDLPLGIAVNRRGETFITGTTLSTDFPTPNGCLTLGGGPSFGFDVFLTRISADGSAIQYSTYFGGNFSDTDVGRSVVVDRNNNDQVYVTGYTQSPDFPITVGSVGVGSDAFVLKFDTSLSGVGSLLYSTTFGLSYATAGRSIAVDAMGQAYVTGTDYSNPTLPDVFLAKLTPAGNVSVVRYLGGSLYDQGNGITLDAAGNVYVVGETDSSDFPVTAGAWQGSGGGSAWGWDAFLTKLTPDFSTRLYSTYYGGLFDSRMDSAQAVAVQAGVSNEVYLTGFTNSPSLPVTGRTVPGRGADTSHNGNLDAFIAKFDTSRSGFYSLRWATYFGGEDDEGGSGIVVDNQGYITIIGSTLSTEATFPVTPHAYSTVGAGGATGYGWDAFIAKFIRIEDRSGLVRYPCLYASYFGDTTRALPEDDFGKAIALGPDGCIHITGDTQARGNFPITFGAFQSEYGGGPYDGWVAKLCLPRFMMGDINGDGCVDILDLGLWINARDSCQGDPNFNPNADINGDDCIDDTDFYLMYAMFDTCDADL
jgi:hypothetical protein